MKNELTDIKNFGKHQMLSIYEKWDEKITKTKNCDGNGIKMNVILYEHEKHNIVEHGYGVDQQLEGCLIVNSIIYHIMKIRNQNMTEKK